MILLRSSNILPIRNLDSSLSTSRSSSFQLFFYLSGIETHPGRRSTSFSDYCDPLRVPSAFCGARFCAPDGVAPQQKIFPGTAADGSGEALCSGQGKNPAFSRKPVSGLLVFQLSSPEKTDAPQLQSGAPVQTTDYAKSFTMPGMMVFWKAENVMISTKM